MTSILHRHAPLFLAAILLLAAAVHLTGLGQESLWADEFYTLLTVDQDSAADVVEAVAQRDPHPPLYFLTLYGWTRYAGLTDKALRLPSALGGIASVWLMYLVALQIWPGSRRRALLAALIAALSPFLAWYAQEARSYSLLVTMELAGMWGVLRLMREDLRPQARAIGGTVGALAIAAACWMHYFGLFIWFWAMTALILYPVVQRRARQWPETMGLILGVIAGGPIAIRAVRDLVSEKGLGWLTETLTAGRLLDILQAQVAGPIHPAIPVPLPVIALIVVSGILAFAIALPVRQSIQRRSIPREWPLALAFVSLLVLPTVVGFFLPIVLYGQRYLIIAVPVFQLVLLWGLEFSRLRKAIIVAIAIELLCGSIYIADMKRTRQHRVWDRAAEMIEAHAQRGDALLVLPPRLQPLAERYMKDPLPAADPLAIASPKNRPQRIWLITLIEQTPYSNHPAYRVNQTGILTTHHPGNVLYLRELVARE
ncbi:glycosyltransferase family 39 protein [bacterium]|nr:glycosyltransferase family 39 protein [bacterium]